MQENNAIPAFNLPSAPDNMLDTLGIAAPVIPLRPPKIGPIADCMLDITPEINPPKNCSAAQSGTFINFPSNSLRNFPTKLLSPFNIFSIAHKKPSFNSFAAILSAKKVGDKKFNLLSIILLIFSNASYLTPLITPDIAPDISVDALSIRSSMSTVFPSIGSMYPPENFSSLLIISNKFFIVFVTLPIFSLSSSHSPDDKVISLL